MSKKDTIYFTMVATDFYYGNSFLEKGDIVSLEKEPDNQHDKEAIMVKVEGLGRIGYVANSTHTVLGESMSAGRMYDKVEDGAQAEVMYIMDRGVLCRLI
ncbi:MAG: HIRAN domain-containing protein [Bacillota bacterium]|nr:HIRAN domain-containing protein [Bacillota bacterium]